VVGNKDNKALYTLPREASFVAIEAKIEHSPVDGGIKSIGVG
jgi:hypothetical protein